MKKNMHMLLENHVENKTKTKKIVCTNGKWKTEMRHK